ncbi:hypothetical protein WJX79_010095 [Trebouxia sp. C0005]
MADREEQYILRVEDKAVAARIRKQLNSENSKAKLDVRFDALHNEGRTGQFSFGSEVLPVSLLNLPCVVESYKTYDDSHLVKMCDVGQMLHVHAEGSNHPEHFDSINGITPAMRNARQRHFNNVNIPFEAVTAVEDDLLQIVQGRAPQNTIIEDVEEEYKSQAPSPSARRLSRNPLQIWKNCNLIKVGSTVHPCPDDYISTGKLKGALDMTPHKH